MVAGTRDFCMNLLTEVPEMLPSMLDYVNIFCGSPSSIDDAQPCECKDALSVVEPRANRRQLLRIASPHSFNLPLRPPLQMTREGLCWTARTVS